MDLTGDEIAGVVDLFGGLHREELGQALAELGYKREGSFEPAAFDADIEAAIDRYHLVRVGIDAFEAESPVDSDGSASTDTPEAADSSTDTGGTGGTDTLLVAGPGAFPSLPEGATDLVHILDIEKRPVDRSVAGSEVLDRFREDAATAVDAADDEWVTHLIDVSYELEAWADVDLAAERDHLDATT